MNLVEGTAMASVEPSDHRERRERDRERTKSPATNGGGSSGGGGSLNRQSSRNIRVLTPETSRFQILIFLTFSLFLHSFILFCGSLQSR